ncbi:MAG: deoxyribodipyrimidine photolyase [Aestuariivita sp.]|nr:deoxyribodipyrimidine photolyase [Aestuariivita sp.]
MPKSIIYWIRRDLRLRDNPALDYAVQSSRAVIPVFILDEREKRLGAAPKWRLGLGLEHISGEFAKIGSKIVLRSGEPEAVINNLISETDADIVCWNRLYDPIALRRDSGIKESLTNRGIKAISFAGSLIFEPWTVSTGSGGFYRVYTPFWNAVKGREAEAEYLPPKSIKTPVNWPLSDNITDWKMGKAMGRGERIVRPFVRLGQAKAIERLAKFLDDDAVHYADRRNIPSVLGTSGLSENLALGEISPKQCWHGGKKALYAGVRGAEIFLKEIVWREFAYHLMFHTPHILDSNWKPDWDKFPWQTDEKAPAVLAWKQGRTGVPFVDAAMREMYVTGRMHNRGRMIVASYLTKHLLCHWKIGQKWFEQCLIDWDPASNAMGWQWSAGSGPDATPYFRIFNAETQLAKFDPEGHYINYWIAELSQNPSKTANKFFDAIPKSWNLNPQMAYPNAIMSMKRGRERALNAYESRGF